MARVCLPNGASILVHSGHLPSGSLRPRAYWGPRSCPAQESPLRLLLGARFTCAGLARAAGSPPLNAPMRPIAALSHSSPWRAGMQASGLQLAWFSRVPRGAGLAMAMLAFLQSDPVVGAKWTDIQFKGAIDCLAANGLTMPEELANLQFDDLKDADGATALTKGVLRRALDRATVAAAKASSPGAAGPAPASAGRFGSVAAESWAPAEGRACRHRRWPGPDQLEGPSGVPVAEAAARLRPGALARFHRSLRSAKTDALATEVQRAKSRGIARPFIYTELAKFQPLCARGAGGSPDDDEPESKEAAALARAFGRGTAAESQPLLAWTPWHQAFDAWSVAAAVTDQISYTSAMAHKHVVLQASRHWRPSAGRRSGRACPGCTGCPPAGTEGPGCLGLRPPCAEDVGRACRRRHGWLPGRSSAPCFRALFSGARRRAGERCGAVA